MSFLCSSGLVDDCDVPEWLPILKCLKENLSPDAGYDLDKVIKVTLAGEGSQTESPSPRNSISPLPYPLLLPIRVSKTRSTHRETCRKY